MMATEIWSNGHPNAGVTIEQTRVGYRIRGGAIGYKGLRVSGRVLEEVVDRAWEWITRYSLDKVWTGSRYVPV